MAGAGGNAIARCQYNGGLPPAVGSDPGGAFFTLARSMFPDLSPTLLHTLYLVAIVAEAMTAALSAGRRDMDWMGVCIIACVTALGGGSLRDVLLGHYPLTWVVHPEYLWMTAGAALLTALIAPIMRRLRSLFLLADALGLVAFTVIGCQVCLLYTSPSPRDKRQSRMPSSA